MQTLFMFSSTQANHVLLSADVPGITTSGNARSRTVIAVQPMYANILVAHSTLLGVMMIQSDVNQRCS